MVLMQSIYGTYGCLMDEWVIFERKEFFAFLLVLSCNYEETTGLSCCP
jgi:hypothetical protein